MDKRHARLPVSAPWFVVSVAAMLTFFLCAASVYEGAPPPPPEDPYVTSYRPESAVIRDTIFDKTLEKKFSGFESNLAAVIRQSGLSAQERTEQLTASGYDVTDDRVQVQITVDPLEVEQVITAIENLGGEITTVSQVEDRLQGWIPLASLKEVDEISGVYKISRPAYAHPADVLAAGSSMTEGVSVMNAAAWHTAGFMGDGVKVGIIDVGFLGFTSLLGTDLPAIVTSKNFVDGETDPQVDGTSEHGTACAEIVHDVAPGADLYLAKVDTALDLQDAMLWLKDIHQVDIISTSLILFNMTPGDGTGEFANWVNYARSADILWVTAAGNSRENHWGGTFSDTDGDINQAHNFDVSHNETCLGPSGACYLIPPGVPITIYLRWDDWTTVTQDYDLTLVRCTSDWLSCSDYDWSWDHQDGSPGQTPTEAIFSVTSGAEAFYLLAVENYASTRDVDFELFSIEAPLEFQVYARSIANLADAPGAVTVAALDVWPSYPQESYSSEGPTNGPSGTAGGGFIKPDIAAFANVSTESYGPGGFNGTSAATPHVAGAAALIKSAYSSFTPDQLQTYLEINAVDMGSPGMDTLFGYGRLLLPPPPPTPIFEDVPSNHWAFDYINALFNAGYVAGCSTEPRLYCPDNILSRAESAVFVLRGQYGGDYLPPAPSGIFADVDLGIWYADWVESMWVDSFTAGCGTNPLIYCPSSQHTRAEGSVFFLRAKNGADYLPPAPSGIFTDVDIDAWYADWVEAAYNEGILPECSTDPLQFCPENQLDRAWAAYMMVQAKGGLPLP